MKPYQKLSLAAAAVAVVVAAIRNGYKPKSGIEKAIIDEANRQGVDPKVALAFAAAESNFQPGLVGDASWPFSGDISNHERHVLNNPVFDSSPYRTSPGLWVSYGIYQLLSPYQLQKYDANADPRVLLDPEINIRIGISVIKNLLKKYGNVEDARIAYVCGSPGGCSESRSAEIVEKFKKKLSGFA